MRVLTWNVNHRARRRPIPGWVGAAIAGQCPDLLVLCEYVTGPDHTAITESLRREAGLGHVLVSDRVPAHNQILIASRRPLRPGSLRAPAIHPAVPPNFLHAVTDDEVHLVGLRIPVGKDFDPLKRPTWEWLLEATDRLREQTAVITGDLNTDVGDPAARCGDCLQRYFTQGWTDGSPAVGGSFGGPAASRRIDHLIVSPSLSVQSTRYVWDFVSHLPVQKFPVGLPDHAMLVAELGRTR